MKKGESRLEVSKMGVILFLGSSLSLESEELCVGGEGGTLAKGVIVET